MPFSSPLSSSSLCWYQYHSIWWPCVFYGSTREALKEAQRANLKPMSLIPLYTREINQKNEGPVPVLHILGSSPAYFTEYKDSYTVCDFFDFILDHSKPVDEIRSKYGDRIAEQYARALDECSRLLPNQQSGDSDTDDYRLSRDSEEEIASESGEEALEDEEDTASVSEFPFANQATTFSALWEELEMMGWTLRADGVYIRPSCNTRTGIEGQDYFSNKERLQEFCKKQYGWKPILPSSSKTVASTSVQTPNVKTKPQDPSAPLLSADVSLDSEASDPYHWNLLWPALKDAGWTYCNAWGSLDSYYYIRRGIDKGWCRKYGKMGVDFFRSAEDVIEYCRKEYKVRPHREDEKPTSIRVKGKNLFNVKRTGPTSSVSTSRKKAKKNSDNGPTVTPKSPERRNPSRGSRSTGISSSSKAPESPPHWWKSSNVPGEEDLWPILEKIGCSKDSQGYSSPCSDIVTESFSGLMALMARVGLPSNHFDELPGGEKDILDRALRFANVPFRSKKLLRKVSSFKGFEDLAWFLNQQFLWQFCGGKLYLPNSDSKARQAGSDDIVVVSRKPRIHYFEEKHYNDLRVYLRDVWNPLSHLQEEFLLGKKDEYVRVRLHGAASSMPLQHPDLSTYSWIEKVDETDRLCYESMPNHAQFFGLSDVKTSSFNRTITPDEKPAKTTKGQNLKWYKVQDLLTEQEAWPLLKQLGFVQKSNSYHLSGFERSFESLQSIRSFLCKSGIPDIQKLDKTMRLDLENWVKFANVPHPDRGSAESFEDVRVLSEIQVLTILHGLGFTTVDTKCYPPGHNRVGHRNYKHKEHYWKLPDEIYEFIRANDSFYIGDFPEEWSIEDCKNVSEQDLLALRVHAAAFPIGLPSFNLADVKNKHDAVKESKFEDQSSSCEEEDESERNIATYETKVLDDSSHSNENGAEMFFSPSSSDKENTTPHSGAVYLTQAEESNPFYDAPSPSLPSPTNSTGIMCMPLTQHFED